MRSTNPTAPSRMSSAGLISPTTSSCSGVTVAPMRVLYRGKAGGNRLHLSLSLLKSDARLDPRDHVEKMITALRCFLIGKRDWHPYLVVPVAIGGQVHRARHDANHIVAFPIQRDGASDDVGIRTEAALPE